MGNDRDIWVVGHKNPDTDSICAAIAYANLKNLADDGNYVPKKAGEISNETRFVLEFFAMLQLLLWLLLLVSGSSTSGKYIRKF